MQSEQDFEIEKEVNEILARCDALYEEYSCASSLQIVFKEILDCEQQLDECIAQQKAIAKRFKISPSARRRAKEERQKLEIQKNDLLSRRSSARARQAELSSKAESDQRPRRAHIIAAVKAELSRLLEEAEYLKCPLSYLVELSPFYTVLNMNSSLEEMNEALWEIKALCPAAPRPDLPPYDCGEELFKQLKISTDIVVNEKVAEEASKALHEKPAAMGKHITAEK